MKRRLVLDHATIADLRGRFPVDPDRTTRLQRVVLNQERSATNAETEDALLADEECDLADALERRGVPVTPSRAQRQRRLTVALRRL